MAAPALALALLLVVGGGQSGNEASIEGTITDTFGAVVPGVAVTAANRDTGAVFNATTDGHGRFVFLVLQAGRYEVAAERAGFARSVQRDLLVAVGAKVFLRIQMEITGRQEEVTVKGASPLLETTRTSFVSRVDARSIADLPLNGRNFLNFVLLCPGFSTAGGGSGGFFSAGGQSSMNSLLIDGADHNGFSAAPVGTAGADRYLFSQDAIQEFEVKTGAYSAEFGRAGTAVVNVVTKSGSNQVRGSAFWYYRDDALSAKGYIEKVKGASKEAFHAHQFGAEAGGPVVRDRLFFYGNYDGQRRTARNLTLLNLPPAFRLSADPTIAGYQSRALDYLTARADPYMRAFNQNVVFVKLDTRVADGHFLTGQWNSHRLNADNFASGGPAESWEHSGSDGQVANSFTAALKSALSLRAVNVLRGSFVSTRSPQEGNSNYPEAIVQQDGDVVLRVGRLPRLQANGVWHAELADTLSLARGRHTPKLGGSVLVENGRFFSTVNFYGAYSFNSLESFGRNLAGFPQPQATERYMQAFSGEGTPPIDVRPRYVELAAFAEDTWGVRQGLTVDLGLRYDVQVMAKSKVRNPSAALLAAGVDTSFVPTDADNFAPRVGVAWTPGHGGRLLVRGGYGLFFPRLMGATVARSFAQNAITSQTRTFTGRSIPAYPNTMCGAPDPSGAMPNCPAPAAGLDMIMAIAPDYEQSGIQQGSVGAEYALRPDLSVSATYLRTKGTNLMHWQDINLAEPATASIAIAGTDNLIAYRQYSALRPISGFERVFLLNTNGHSSYHALALQVTKRWSSDFQFAVAYTLATVTDDNPTLGSLTPGSGDAELLSDSLDPGLDRGPGDTSQRHRLVLYGVWALNYANGLPRAARAIFGDWTLSGIVTANTGAPYSGVVNYDLNRDGNTRTDRPPGGGRNTFCLPAFASVDARLARTIRLNRRSIMQLSIDAFNLFNRANIGLVTKAQYKYSQKLDECGIAGTPCLVPQQAFGTPTMAFDPRTLQLSARLSF